MLNFLTGLSEIREGGSYHRFIRMVDALANRGFKTLVYSTSPDVLKKENVIWKQTFFISKLPFKNFMFFLAFPFIVVKDILTNNLKQIIVFGPVYASLLIPLKLCKKCRIYCMVRGILSNEYGYQEKDKILIYFVSILEKMGFSASHRIIVVSKTLMKRIQKDFGISKNKIFYLPNEIPDLSHERIDTLFGIEVWGKKLPGNGLRLFSGGVITAIKNYEFLINSVELLKIPFHLCIAGKPGNNYDEEYFFRLRSKIKQLKLENHISWLGWLPRERLLGTLASSHLFLGASHHEGMSNIFLEALALDIPCVAMKTADSLELLQSDNLLFESPDELAKMVTQFYKDRQFSQKISLLCRQAKKNWTFDWDEKLIELLM